MKFETSWLPLAAATALVMIGCDDPVDPGPPGPELVYEGSVVTSATANVNSLGVEVSATGYEAVQLRMRTDGEPDEVSPTFPLSDGVADASALGLLAGRDYRIDVLLHAGSQIDSVDTLERTVGPLPAWLPDIGATGDPADDGLIGLAHPSGPIVVDNQGRVRWYLESEDPILNNFMSHPSGEYTIYGLEDAGRFYRVLDERGDVIRTLGCVGLETRFHEIRVMPGGDYWALCDDPVPTDLSARGGSADGTVVWTRIQHIGTDGSLLSEFDTGAHFSLDDIDPTVIEGAETVTITHGNAIEFDSDGNLLLSFRNLNEITKVDPTADEVVWRLGGRANQFTVDDPRAFVWQHGLRLVEPGVIQFLDNGGGPPSRLLRYEIDEQAMTATVALEYVHPGDVFTRVGGNSEVLANDRGLVSFGQAGRVAEVDAAGNLTFELTGLDGQYVFRAFRIPSLYASERRTP